MKQIYFDNNGTTPLDPRIIEAMVEELHLGPSNPSSIHAFGRAAKNRLQRSRELVANHLRAKPDEIIFTSSGTESLNLAILGMQTEGKILSTRIEHAAVYNTLARTNRPVEYLPIDATGHIDPEDLEKALSPEIGLIVLSAVNSETGVKNPLEAIAKIARAHNTPLIVDGVALLGKELFTIPEGVTAMAFSGHKIHGPKGVGCLFLRKGTPLSAQLSGGGQERNLRAGTENLVGIIGFAKAVELIDQELPEASFEMARLRDLLESSLEGAIPVGTGPRVCNTSCLTFPGMDGESLLIQLDMVGICASMGSACSSGALEPSRVLLEMGLTREEARSTLRFSLSRFTTEEEIRAAVATLTPLMNLSV